MKLVIIQTRLEVINENYEQIDDAPEEAFISTNNTESSN